MPKKKAKNTPPQDPALPAEFLAALDSCWGMARDAGVLIGGLGGPPFHAGRLRDAIAARFGLEGARLAEAETLVHRAIRDDLTPERLPAERLWVNKWRAPRNTF